MKCSFNVVALALFVVMLAFSNVDGACLANNDGCQPDGSMGICCSGFCYKQVGWNMGVCANRRKRAVCLGNGMPCKWNGSRGNCCSGFCLQQPNQDWGRCQ